MPLFFGIQQVCFTENIPDSNRLHIPQNLRIRSEGTERHSALN